MGWDDACVIELQKRKVVCAVQLSVETQAPPHLLVPSSTVRPSWRRALRCFDPTTHPLIFLLFIKVPIIPNKKNDAKGAPALFVDVCDVQGPGEIALKGWADNLKARALRKEQGTKSQRRMGAGGGSVQVLPCFLVDGDDVLLFVFFVF